MHCTLVMPTVSVSAAQDLVQLVAPSDRSLELTYAIVSGASLETAEVLPLGFWRATVAGTGTAATPQDVEGGGQVFGGSAAYNLTVAATKAATPLLRFGADVASGWEWEVRTRGLVVPPGGILVLRVDAAPSGATPLTATLEFHVRP